MTPPEDPLGPDHVDDQGRPDWISDRPGARWLPVASSVQLEDRIVIQNEVVTDNPLDSPNRRSFRDGPVFLPFVPISENPNNPRPIAPWQFPVTRQHARKPPSIRDESGRPKRKTGRPSWADKNPDLPIFIAWARDVAGIKLDDVIDLTGQGRGAVPRLADQGRELLARWGVLPWAAYEDNRPPKGWPNDERFLRALEVWADEAEVIADGGELPGFVFRA
jgi:hypothetical protein